jgi:biopolymer transport protein ExbD
MGTNLSRLQRRVRNRRSGSRRPALFSSLDSSAFAQPMIGCVVVLLIVSMVSVPSGHGWLFDRYVSRHATPMPGALREDAMRVVVTRDGTVYFGNTRIAIAQLAEQIRQRVQSGAQHRVFFSVDQRAQFGDLAIALDEVRHAGIWDITFLAESPVPHR